MPKDFDALRKQREQRERSFTIAGREWHFRPALPAETYSLYLELMDQMSQGRWPSGAFDILNGTILALLEDGEQEAWEEIVAVRNGNPLSFEDLSDVIDYCVGIQTGRPTQPRSPSGTTGGSGGTSSTDGSGLREVPAPAASISGAS
jgi:hypothetical protein